MKMEGSPEHIQRFFEQGIDIDKESHPKGKIRSDDKGELVFAIGIDRTQRSIIIDFNKPVNWLGLDKESTEQLIQILQDRVKELT